MPLDYILQVFRAIWKNSIFNIWKSIEKLKLYNHSFAYNSNPKHFKIVHFGVKFCK